MTNEDAAGVLNNVVDSLRNNPLVIGLLVLNIVFVLSSLYVSSTRSEATKEIILEIMRECRQARQYVPQSQTFPQNTAPLALPSVSAKADRVGIEARPQ